MIFFSCLASGGVLNNKASVILEILNVLGVRLLWSWSDRGRVEAALALSWPGLKVPGQVSCTVGRHWSYVNSGECQGSKPRMAETIPLTWGGLELDHHIKCPSLKGWMFLQNPYVFLQSFDTCIPSSRHLWLQFQVPKSQLRMLKEFWQNLSAEPSWYWQICFFLLFSGPSVT